MKSETTFAILAILVATLSLAVGGISIGLQLGTQSKLDKLDAEVAAHLEQFQPKPRPVRPPFRPGELGSLEE